MYACFFFPAIDCTCVRLDCTPQLRLHNPPHRCRADPVFRPCWLVSLIYYHMTRSHMTATVFWTQAQFYDTFTLNFVEWRLTVLWVLERCWARTSCSVCDTTGRDLVLICWVDLLCFSPHCDTAMSCLTNDTLNTSSSSTDCYDDWLQASLTFAVRLMTPAVCVVAVVNYAVFNDVSAALCLMLDASYVFWVTFLVVCYVIDSFSLFVH